MSEQSYSAKLRELSKNYYQSHLGYEEYRAQRKEVLDKIDEEFNGRKPVLADNGLADNGSEQGQEPETNSSVLMKTIAFFKNNDIDN